MAEYAITVIDYWLPVLDSYVWIVPREWSTFKLVWHYLPIVLTTEVSGNGVSWISSLVLLEWVFSSVWQVKNGLVRHISAGLAVLSCEVVFEWDHIIWAFSGGQQWLLNVYLSWAHPHAARYVLALLVKGLITWNEVLVHLLSAFDVTGAYRIVHGCICFDLAYIIFTTNSWKADSRPVEQVQTLKIDRVGIKLLPRDVLFSLSCSILTVLIINWKSFSVWYRLVKNVHINCEWNGSNKVLIH